MNVAQILEYVTITALLGLVILHADQVGPLIQQLTKIFTNAAKVASK